MTLAMEFFGALLSIIAALGERVIGENPNEPERLLRKMFFPADGTNWIGPGGILNVACCALDVAIWDLVGKRSNQPLWRLLGGASDRARTYDSGSLGRWLGIEDIQQAAARSMALGHRAMKMRPGVDLHGTPERLGTRVGAVREVIGYDIELMMDVNKSWTPSRAIRVGNQLEEFQLSWIEDPVAAEDIAGQAAVAAAVVAPVCSGEYHWGLTPLLRLLEQRAVDILMIDLMRVGGITQFRKAAALAEVFETPVVSHLMPEIYAHLIAAVPNGLFVETMPWTAPLFNSVPEVVSGELVLGASPGHGLELNGEFIHRHRVGEDIKTSHHSDVRERSCDVRSR